MTGIEIESVFEQLLRARSFYVQIRYIENSALGKELIRVNKTNSEVVKVRETQLQEKATRNYYQEGLKLLANEVYISPISLNYEHGQVERPFNPVVRAVTPIYINKVMQGLVVINMTLKPQFQKIVTSNRKGITTYVINGSGDFFAHQDQNKLFGSSRGITANIKDILPNVLTANIDNKNYSYIQYNSILAYVQPLQFYKKRPRGKGSYDCYY